MGEALTIGEVADRTGVSVATLRVWETRHGFPVPQRRASGHRRYADGDVTTIREVIRLREAGVRLDAAITRAVREAAASRRRSGSVYAELRRLHPDLPVQRLRKRTLRGLSHAIEDELGARAERAVLFGGFQREVFFAPARARWRGLARVSRAAYVFADFPALETDGALTRVPLGADSPMRGEWVVGGDAPGLAVVLAAWELPGQDDAADDDRLFESVWTLEPPAVRDACLAALRVAAGAGVDTADLLAELTAAPPAATGDPVQGTALLHRALAYGDDPAAGRR